jgi:hypothetical protein
MHLPDPKPQKAQPVLPAKGDHPADERAPMEVNRVAGACERCMTWVEVGGGEVIRLGRRSVLRCFPRCSLPGRPMSAPQGPAEGGVSAT